MSFYFRDAELISRLALVGIAGQSRSGKTLTALRVAHGIVSVTGGKVAAIDTEAGRMLEYGPGAKPFGYAFQYAQFDPPFTGERYLAILLEAEKVAGAGGVIVIDSMSHEHEGDGGVLEQHESLVEKMGPQSNMTAWNRAKLGRKKLINYVRSQRKCHLIMCFRAEQKTGVNPSGKPVDLGIQLIGWHGWKFEMSLFVMLNREQRGVELSHDTTAGLDQLLPAGQITEETGKALAMWCKGSGSQPQATKPPAVDHSRPSDGKQISVWLSPTATVEASASEALAALADAIDRAVSEAELNALIERNSDLLNRLKESNMARMQARIKATQRRLDEEAADSGNAFGHLDEPPPDDDGDQPSLLP